MTRILIISSDAQFSRMLNCTLIYNGFLVEMAPSLEDAWSNLQQIHFDLLLTDCHVRDGKGIKFAEELRRCGFSAPIMIMGECYDEVSMIEGMKSTIDDYILKPFGMSELKMVINKQLDRKRYMTKPLQFGELKIDVAHHRVTVKNKILSLGKKEFEVLMVMTKKAGRIVTLDRLVTEKRVIILSKKLKDAAGEALQIKTVTGLGYKLVARTS